jgi:hypothetical protein
MPAPFLTDRRREVDDDMMAFLADLSAEHGGRFAPITYAWIGSFDPDGVFHPDEQDDLHGTGVIPTVRIGTYVAGRSDEPPGRRFRRLLYYPSLRGTLFSRRSGSGP